MDCTLKSTSHHFSLNWIWWRRWRWEDPRQPFETVWFTFHWWRWGRWRVVGVMILKISPALWLDIKFSSEAGVNSDIVKSRRLHASEAFETFQRNVSTPHFTHFIVKRRKRRVWRKSLRWNRSWCDDRWRTKMKRCRKFYPTSKWRRRTPRSTSGRSKFHAICL